jgi:hypothetical protein
MVGKQQHRRWQGIKDFFHETMVPNARRQASSELSLSTLNARSENQLRALRC